MRRKDRELTEEEALEIVRTSHYAVIATCDASGTPYAVPVSPVWIDGALYFHSAADPAGRRASNLAQNPRVSLCYLARCRSVYEPPETFTVNYASAVVAGCAERVTDEAERRRAALALCAFQCPDAPQESVENAWAHSGDRITVWKVIPEKISGKARRPKTAAPAAK
jgi:uncharacterized protein